MFASDRNPVDLPTPERLTRSRRPWRLRWQRWRAAAGGSPHAMGRMAESVRQAELDGLVFAFWARTTAIVVVSIWLLATVAWPRNAYYVGLAALFFALGFVPYRLRHHRRAELIKLGFVVLDAALITAAILLPPPAGLSAEWPIQTRTRGPEFLLLTLLVAEAALTYSPLAVLWTGGAVAAIWSIGFGLIYGRADTLRFVDVRRAGPLTNEQALRMVFDPTYVGLNQGRLQVLATLLLTGILAIAVWRSRLTLLRQVQAEVVRSDLARYVSPDVADALANHAPAGFGEPARRVVAVLFADIVGFTALTEALSPERTFELLRSFQTRSSRIVFEHGGTLDKFLGDGFMATFGGLDDRPDAAAQALACAFGIQEELARWNAKRVDRAAVPVRIAVGVHCGPVVVGNLGGEHRLDFTVVGDVVNVASRLEECTREVDGAIVTSATCLAAAGEAIWGPRFARATELRLRGRGQVMRVHVADREPV